jgi:ribonuclease BN (tRNA processing enzyme)
MKDWVANNIGIPKVSLGTWFGKERTIGPYYPFKDNPTSEEPQTSTAPQIGGVKTAQTQPAPAAPQAAQEVDASGLSKTASELEKQITGQIGTAPELQLPSNPEEAKNYAFCSDTVYNEDVISIIKNVTVLYHESTFLESESHLAEKTMHTTAKQAAKIAKLADVKHLLLGHYSTRYGNIELFRTEANEIFENVLLADDGLEFEF